MITARFSQSVLRFPAPCLALPASAGAPPLAYSATPEEAGLEIAVEACPRAEGFGNCTAR